MSAVFVLNMSRTFPVTDKNETLVNAFNHGFSYRKYGIYPCWLRCLCGKCFPKPKEKHLENVEKLWKK